MAMTGPRTTRNRNRASSGTSPGTAPWGKWTKSRTNPPAMLPIPVIDSRDGQLLFEQELPLSAPTLPMTYLVEGKQYVVISAEGLAECVLNFHAQTYADLGDAPTAFALPG